MPVEAPVTTASLRALVVIVISSGVEHDLDAAVLLVAKGLVELRAGFELGPVSDDERRIDFTILDALEQLGQIALHRRLRHPERQPTIDRRTHRYLVEISAI